MPKMELEAKELLQSLDKEWLEILKDMVASEVSKEEFKQFLESRAKS